MRNERVWLLVTPAWYDLKLPCCLEPKPSESPYHMRNERIWLPVTPRPDLTWSGPVGNQSRQSRPLYHMRNERVWLLVTPAWSDLKLPCCWEPKPSESPSLSHEERTGLITSHPGLIWLDRESNPGTKRWQTAVRKFQKHFSERIHFYVDESTTLLAVEYNNW
jgi:hypothetical protein